MSIDTSPYRLDVLTRAYADLTLSLWLGLFPPTHIPLEVIVPWYWSDDVARFLISEGRLDRLVAESYLARPVAIKRNEQTLADAAHGLQDDDEIPLAA